MGSTYRVQVANVPPGVTRDALRAEADEILSRIDRQFSTYREDSEIMRFNRARSTGWHAVSPELVLVARSARRMSQRSRGAFDITAAPLVTLWGFGPGQATATQVPRPADIRRVRRAVGYQKLDIREDPPALRKQLATVTLDANALVPGFAADRIAARFEQLGLRNFLVDIGGEFRLRGRTVGGRPWRIAIEAPMPDEQRPMRVLAVTDCAIATSGSYRNYFVDQDRHYSHVLDPRTGSPVSHDLVSVTVIAPSALQADAWATTLLVLGEQDGLALARQENIAALFIARREGAFDEQMSEAFHAYLEPGIDPPRTALPPPE